jgi:alpha-L-fucosidase
MDQIKRIACLALFFLCQSLLAQETWENPIQKEERLGSPLVETSPFVFQEKLYLLENNQRFWDIPGAKPGDYFHEDEIRIRDLEADQIVATPLKNHGFGTVLTWEGKVYVFAGDYGQGKPWRKMTEITMTSSEDLINWSEPKTVLRAHDNEYFFNTAVCRGKDGFVLLYETSDKQWQPFTFRYMQSTDLENWQEIPGAIYGENKYVGGPALYYGGGWYYTLYLESLQPGYETRITRSKDLIKWEDAPEDRPFVTFNPSHKNIPLIDPDISENNASDVELCYFQGKTILYFTGSDQTTAGDLQRANFDGTPEELFKHFFKDNGGQSNVAPKHQGDWLPVLEAGTEGEGAHYFQGKPFRTQPTAGQLAYQERQLGAFIHFGPATFINSDMMSVPAAEIFNPKRLDAEQWAKTAKSFGAKHIVLTAKHHNGFCLWPTETTEYSVKNASWKNGNGDVVRAFVDACRKYDLEIGLYVSGGDKHFGVSSTPDPQGERKIVGDIHKYFPVFLEQLRELLTNYGEISYLWFDGAYDPFGWDVMNPETMIPLGTAYGDAITNMVRLLQPEAIIMGGTSPDVRWSGSEQGWAEYPLENVVQPGEGFEKWVGPQSAGWIPAEANLHTRANWFWTPDSDKTLRDLPFLMNVYAETIGRGANLLVNMTPDTSGLIPDAEVKRLAEFGEAIAQTFSQPIASRELHGNNPKNTYTLSLPKNQSVNLVVLEENIAKGQHIDQYTLESYTGTDWQAVGEGLTIGRKRIHYFDPVKTDKMRISLKGDSGKMALKSFTVYQTD